MQGKWMMTALVALLFSVSAAAEHNHHNDQRRYNNGHHDYRYDDNRQHDRNYRYRPYAPGFYRSKPVPFSYYSYYSYERPLRVYPRHNPRRHARAWQHFDNRYRPVHYHRHRPLLEIRAHFDLYMHCPGHGGYFHVDDYYYR